ncbi:hypothetical protein [Pelomonas cellulosilytica]|uniref:Response regulatory domain-containing protein n=1 Tax=Pelomonas cellulosilytica TaxID=2906762 RepID=A0ABS8XUP0_9BURK|nr:hypothetical protein [Pelomonas sp. P8]MCE4554429.1 hypothetical protein [Pelomonas sp. P8]
MWRRRPARSELNASGCRLRGGARGDSSDVQQPSEASFRARPAVRLPAREARSVSQAAVVLTWQRLLAPPAHAFAGMATVVATGHPGLLACLHASGIAESLHVPARGEVRAQFGLGLPAEAPQPLGRGLVALIIDPDAGCIEPLAELLYAAEFEVQSAVDAQQATVLLSELQPALMICGDVAPLPARSLLIAARSLPQPAATVLYTDRPQPAAPRGEPDFGARCLKPMAGPAWWALLGELLSPRQMSSGAPATSASSIAAGRSALSA